MNDTHCLPKTRSPALPRILVIEAWQAEDLGASQAPEQLMARLMAQLIDALTGDALTGFAAADQGIGDVVVATGQEGLALWRSQPFALVILPLTHTDDLAWWAPIPAASTQAEANEIPLILVVVPAGQDALAQQAIH